MSDAVWQTQINGLYGTLFRRNKEAAFSNYRLWESLGFVIAYAYSTALCARMKLYAVMCVLAFGAFCYIIVEIRQLRKVRGCQIYLECVKIFKYFASILNQDRKQKELERKLEQPATEAQRKIEDETDDEQDELEEDIVVTRM